MTTMMMMLLGIVKLFIAISYVQAYDSTNETSAAALLDRLYSSIDPRVRPGIYGDPTTVEIDFYVQSFGPLNEVEMEFALDLDFRETWQDPRLTFNSTLDLPVYIPPKDIDKFWIPDVYFPTEKVGKLHDITIPNRSIRIYRNGTVRYFSRMAMIVSCTMYLQSFPLDKQQCSVKISTYSYDRNEIELQWRDVNSSIEIKEEELNLPQFRLKSWKQKQCVETYKTGNFSCLQALFYLDRMIGFFVLQTYIPSILIVMLSWVAFWINKNSEPARITLGVTTVLTMTTQLTSSRSNSMRVSYPKAMDVWYSACMLFVFGALLEYALVNISVRTEKKRTDTGRENQALLSTGDIDVEKNDASSDKTQSRVAHKPGQTPRPWSFVVDLWNNSVTSKGIDHWARRIFPAAFFIFNIIYWAFYANYTNEEHY